MSNKTNPPSPDSIVSCVLDTFDALPRKFQPRQLDDGRREWVPLAGIVLTKDGGTTASDCMKCVALATGMKCLPQSKLALANGTVLHDWHAEILAIRAFNRWLIDECYDLARTGSRSESSWLRWRLQGREVDDLLNLQHKIVDNPQEGLQPFAVKDDVQIHMYCSEAPCGDASMELTMAEQDDPRPWTSQPVTRDDGATVELLGRGNFDHLGIVRRKPARADAPVTLSKSCTDKLTMKQATGLLSGPCSLLIHPRNTYISQLILPQSQSVPTAINRSFGIHGRMAALAERRWAGTGFAFTPFTVTTTTREFAFSKRAAAGNSLTPSNLSALCTPHRQEVIVNGVLQGRKQFDPRGASCVSRRMIWRSLLDLSLLAGLPVLTGTLQGRTYADLKSAEPLMKRTKVKNEITEGFLRNWVKNEGDERWSLE